MKEKLKGAMVDAGERAEFANFVHYEDLLGLALLQIESSNVELPAFALSEAFPFQGQPVFVHYGTEQKLGRLVLVHPKVHLPWRILLNDGSQPEDGAPVTSEFGRLLGLVSSRELSEPISLPNREGQEEPTRVFSLLIPAEFIDAILKIQHPGVNEDLAKVIVGTALGVKSAQFRERPDLQVREMKDVQASPPAEPRFLPADNDAGKSKPKSPSATYSPVEPRPVRAATVGARKDEIKVFTLVNASVEETTAMLQQLFPEDVTFSPVPSQHMVIARGPAERLLEIQALLLRLDESGPARSPQGAPVESEPPPVRPEDVYPPVLPEDADMDAGEALQRDIEALTQKESQLLFNPGIDSGPLGRMRRDAARAIVEARLSQLIETYNKLMDEGRFSEAHGMAVMAEKLISEHPAARRVLMEDRNPYGDSRDATTKDGASSRILQQLQEMQAAAELRGNDIANADAMNRRLPWDSPGDPRWDKHLREGRHLSVKGLRGEFAEHDAQARQVAQGLRASIESGDDAIETGRLRDAVTDAFDARQTLQRRELAELEERLAAIQKSLEARERMKDEIINRRVEELLRPELEWDDVPSRSRPDTTSATRSEERPISDDSDDTPLAAAIKAFNRRYANHPIGKDQPPLTEKEVVAAIRFWKFKRDDAPVSDSEFAAFQRIAETRRLPTGSEFEVISTFTGLDGQTIDAWSVRIRMPAGQKGHTYAFVIRERFADSRVELSETVPERKLEPLRTFDSSKSAAGSASPEDRDGQRTQSPKNLKQIMVALHNYHDVFNHFPPATLRGKGNNGRSDHPHSWRVAILPFIGQAELYQQYRFDEPWDSEHNKSLLFRMPDVYRSPLDNEYTISICTSYFAVVTPDLETDDVGWKRGTLFSNPRGTPMREVTDGTSNTIAIVEAKRKVPWTKPEDIPFDERGTLPAPGGWFAEGFHAGFADGSAHFVSKENGAQTLRHLLLIQDGAAVEPKFVK